jgi:hypothetical protein
MTVKLNFSDSETRAPFCSCWSVQQRIWEPNSLQNYCLKWKYVSLFSRWPSSSARFEGSLNMDLNEISMNLVPFPKLHYLVSSLTPLYTLADVNIPPRRWGTSGFHCLSAWRALQGKFILTQVILVKIIKNIVGDRHFSLVKYFFRSKLF